MIKGIAPVMKKEFRHMLRDKRTLAVLIFLPVFLLIMFGYAISLDVEHIPLGVCDLDRSRESSRFTDIFFHSEQFDFKTFVPAYSDIDNLILREQVKGVLVIPKGFAEKVLLKKPVPVQILIDGSNSSVASTIMGSMEMMIQEYSENRDVSISKIVKDRIVPMELQPRIWYNPELLSARFLVPGLIVLILVVTSVISTCLSIVKEKEHGTIQQIVISPVKPLELIVGKIIPYFLLSIVITAGILILSSLLFGVHVRGSYLLLFVVIIIFLSGSSALGILFSSITDTQQTAFLVSTIITVLPTYILSGFVFPIRNMPAAIQVFTYCIPARYFLSAIRNIMVKGAGIEVVYPDIIALILIAVLTTLLSVFRLKKGGI